MNVSFPAKYSALLSFALIVGLIAHSLSSGFGIVIFYELAVLTTVLKLIS